MDDNACPNDVLIDRLIAGAIDPQQAASLREHVRTCERCRRLAEEARRDEELVATLRRALAAGVLSDDAAPQPHSAPAGEERPVLPRTIAGFRVVRVLAEGGAGTIYEVEQDQPNRPAALKVLKPGAAGSAWGMFEREAEALGRLNHPGIATVYRAGRTERSEPYLLMELVHGEPIDQHVRTRSLGPEEIAVLLAKVCEAVQYAHDQGVLHRDIKPSNILVRPDGTVKLLDFGLARIAGDPSETIYDKSGSLVGTLGYMAPEQVDGDPSRIDGRADIYALGAVAYRLMTGKPVVPTSGLTPAEVVSRICRGEVTPMRKLIAEIPADLEQAIMQALRTRVEERPQSAAELASALRRTGSPRSATPGIRNRRWTWIVAVTALPVAAAALWRAGLLGGSDPDPEKPRASDVRTATAGGVRDLRTDGPPDRSEVATWIWTNHYIVGDARDAWRREQERLSLLRERQGWIQPEELIRAGAAAEAAGANEEASALFQEASQGRNRWQFEAKTRQARLLIRWKGCEEAASEIAARERTADHRKGGNTVFAAHAWLAVAEYYAKLGKPERTAEYVAKADDVMDAVPIDSPRHWYLAWRSEILAPKDAP